MNFFMEMGKTISFTRFEPTQFLSDGDFVIVKGYFAGKGNTTGKTCETEWIMLWEIADDKVISYQAFIDTFNVANALN